MSMCESTLNIEPELNGRVLVAAGIIVNQQGQVLIARRPDHLHQGGLWEFPGGKVEAGEPLANALRRELKEELAIEVLNADPYKTIFFDYPDKQVQLAFFWVDHFQGQACGLEGQEIQWVAVGKLVDYAFPAANQAIVDELVQKQS